MSANSSHPDRPDKPKPDEPAVLVSPRPVRIAGAPKWSYSPSSRPRNRRRATLTAKFACIADRRFRRTARPLQPLGLRNGVPMPDLYLDVACSSCGKSHSLFDSSPVRHPAGSIYGFKCPTTAKPVTVLLTDPQSVILAPGRCRPGDMGSRVTMPGHPRTGSTSGMPSRLFVTYAARAQRNCQGPGFSAGFIAHL